MLETLGEALGALRRLLGQPGADGSRDGEQLRLHAATDPARPERELSLEAPDRALEAGRRVVFAGPSLSGEVDDRSHDAIVDRGSDTTMEAPPIPPQSCAA